MTRQEIRQNLSNALSTGAWGRIQNSLVGKELLNFGTEVIAASNDIKETLIDTFDYTQADQRALISMSHVFNIPVSFFRPAYVRVHLESGTSEIYTPYQLSYQVGNIKFTNIESVMGNEDITLYQGVVKTMKSYEDAYDLIPVNYELTEEWDNTILPVSESETIRCHKLGEAMPESILVFCEDADYPYVMSPFSELRYGSDVKTYKRYTLYDGTQSVLEGNDVWGEEFDFISKYQIVWLQPTNADFSGSGRLYSNGTEISFHLLEQSQGASYDLVYGREYFRRSYLEQSAIVSEKQIRDYVNAQPYIEDCSVTVLNNTVYVYVKPKTYSEGWLYGELEQKLDMHGGLAVLHEVRAGVQVIFQITIDVPGTPPGNASQIETYLATRYSYSNLKFNEIVSTADIASILLSRFGLTASVYFNAEEIFQSGKSLSFRPLSGSIKIFDSNGTQLGYDLSGTLYGFTSASDESIVLSGVNDLQFGNYIYYSGLLLKPYSVDNATYAAVAAFDSSLFGSQFTGCLTHNGFAYLYTEPDAAGVSRVMVYDVQNINEQGLVSTIVPVSGTVQYIGGVTTPSNAAFRLQYPVWYKGILLRLLIDNSALQVEFYTGMQPANPYNVLQLSTGITTIKGVLVKDDNIYIFTGSNSCLVIENIDTSLVRQYYVSVVWPTTATNMGTLTYFHAYKDGCYCAVSGQYILKFRDIEVSSTEIRFVDVYEGYSAGLQCQSGYVTCYEDGIFVVNGGNSPVPLPAVVLDKDVSHIIMNDVSLPLLRGGSSNALGTVNYQTGVVSGQVFSGKTISYSASVASANEDSYLVLDPEHPVLWD